MKINKILIIGFGSIGKRHLTIVNKLFNSVDVKILRSSPKTSVSQDLDLIYSIDDALKFDPQVVVVCNPATKHLDYASHFIKENRYLFIEKPLSNNYEKAEIFIQNCKTSGVKVQVGYNLRFLKSLKKFKELIDKNVIGEIWSVRSIVGSYLPDWRQNNYKNSVSAQKSLGGGVVNELSHEIDYLIWIFGEIQSYKSTTLKQSNLDIDVEDTAHILLKFITNTKKFFVASLDMDFIRSDKIRECTAIGSNGSLRWDCLNGSVSLIKRGEDKWTTIYQNIEDIERSYELQWKEIEECYKNNLEPMVSGDEALKSLKLLDSIHNCNQVFDDIL